MERPMMNGPSGSCVLSNLSINGLILSNDCLPVWQRNKKNILANIFLRFNGCGNFQYFFDPIRNFFPIDASQTDVRTTGDDVRGCGRHFARHGRRGDQSLRDRFGDGVKFGNNFCRRFDSRRDGRRDCLD